MEKNVIRLHVVCLFLTITLLQACDSRQVAITLDDIETYIQTHPDSALTTLRAIDTTALTIRSLRAKFALLHAIALDKNWIDTTDINVVMPAVQYYDKHPSDLRRSKAWYYLGRIQYNGRRYNEAIISFTRAKEYVDNFDDDRFIALVHEALADTYNSTYLFEEALENSGKAYEYSLRAGDSLLANAVLYNIARQQNNLHEYAAADSILSILVLPGKVNKNTIPYILADYALLNITYQKDFYKARELYEQSLSYGKGLVDYRHWAAYGYSLYKTGDTAKSRALFHQLEEKGLQDDYIFLIWQSRILGQEHDYKTAYELLEASSQKQTEGVRQLLRQSAVKAQRDYFLIQKDTLKKENELRKWIIILLVLLVVASGVSLFVFVLHHMENSRRQNRQLMKVIQDVVNLQQANEKLSLYVTEVNTRQQALKQEYFHFSQDNYKELSDLCNTFYKNEGKGSQAQVVCGEVRGLLNHLGIGEDRYSLLEERVNEQFDHIMEHLRAEHPNHKETFFKTACYLFAGFKDRTIAMLLHVDEQDVYQTRWRLKKAVEGQGTLHQADFLVLLKNSTD